MAPKQRKLAVNNKISVYSVLLEIIEHGRIREPGLLSYSRGDISSSL